MNNFYVGKLHFVGQGLAPAVHIGIMHNENNYSLNPVGCGRHKCLPYVWLFNWIT